MESSSSPRPLSIPDLLPNCYGCLHYEELSLTPHHTPSPSLSFDFIVWDKAFLDSLPSHPSSPPLLDAPHCPSSSSSGSSSFHSISFDRNIPVSHHVQLADLAHPNNSTVPSAHYGLAACCDHHCRLLLNQTAPCRLSPTASPKNCDLASDRFALMGCRTDVDLPLCTQFRKRELLPLAAGCNNLEDAVRTYVEGISIREHSDHQLHVERSQETARKGHVHQLDMRRRSNERASHVTMAAISGPRVGEDKRIDVEKRPCKSIFLKAAPMHQTENYTDEGQQNERISCLLRSVSQPGSLVRRRSDLTDSKQTCAKLAIDMQGFSKDDQVSSINNVISKLNESSEEELPPESTCFPARSMGTSRGKVRNFIDRSSQKETLSPRQQANSVAILERSADFNVLSSCIPVNMSRTLIQGQAYSGDEESRTTTNLQQHATLTSNASKRTVTSTTEDHGSRSKMKALWRKFWKSHRQNDSQYTNHAAT